MTKVLGDFQKTVRCVDAQRKLAFWQKKMIVLKVLQHFKV